MCLFATDGTIKTAKKDITVYKVLRVSPYIHSEEEGDIFCPTFITPCWSCPVTLGEELKPGCTDYPPKHIVSKFGDGWYEYGKGWIHTFKTSKEAISFIDMVSEHYDDVFRCDQICVECVIPKGTEYVEGTFDWDGPESLCSRKIIVGKRALYSDVLPFKQYFIDWLQDKAGVEFVKE